MDKQEEMLGSFAPQEKPYEVTFPRQGWEEAPSGMLARGTYHAKAQFIDDDKQCHLEYEYNLGTLFFFLSCVVLFIFMVCFRSTLNDRQLSARPGRIRIKKRKKKKKNRRTLSLLLARWV